MCIHFAGNDVSHATINTLRPRQHGRHFPDDIFRCILLNENIWIAINISLSFVPKGPIDNIPALVQIMAWRRSGDKPLSGPMMLSLLTHICVIRPQWTNITVYLIKKWVSCICFAMVATCFDGFMWSIYSCHSGMLHVDWITRKLGKQKVKKKIAISNHDTVWTASATLVIHFLTHFQLETIKFRFW